MSIKKIIIGIKVISFFLTILPSLKRRYQKQNGKIITKRLILSLALMKIKK